MRNQTPTFVEPKGSLSAVVRPPAATVNWMVGSLSVWLTQIAGVGDVDRGPSEEEELGEVTSIRINYWR